MLCFPKYRSLEKKKVRLQFESIIDYFQWISLTCQCSENLIEAGFDMEQIYHQDNMSVWFIPPCNPLLHSKTGVYRGIHFFLFLG